MQSEQLSRLPLIVPADVPRSMRNLFMHNYDTITRSTGRLFLFACDQKIEHMNDDFSAPSAHSDSADPEHLFRIAHHGRIGAMATQLGLIARYGAQYTQVPYIVKLTAKTNLIPPIQQDPISILLNDVQEVLLFKKESGLCIAGVGLTVYPGSEQEHIMLKQAANTIFAAHQQGLVALLWIYPRGTAITNEADPHLIAGAVGIADALGADFVKINIPTALEKDNHVPYLTQIIHAAGNTRVICSGGAKIDTTLFLRRLYQQLHSGGAHGCAAGRNIFQRSLSEAIALTHAISALVFDNATLEHALVFMKNLS